MSLLRINVSITYLSNHNLVDPRCTAVQRWEQM